MINSITSFSGSDDSFFSQHISNSFMILIMPFKSSFEMTKAIPFPVFTTSRLFIFLSIAPFIAEANAMAVNITKTFLAKRTATCISGTPNLPNKAPQNPPD